VVEKPLAELAAELPGRVAVARLNADENPVVTGRHRVMSMPTLLFFRDGVVVHRGSAGPSRSCAGSRHLRRGLRQPLISGGITCHSPADTAQTLSALVPTRVISRPPTTMAGWT
jgi:hypothetical protein